MDSVRVVLFDLDDTLWHCGRTLSRCRDKFAERYPLFARLDQEKLVRDIASEFPDRSHDYTFLRKVLLRRHNPPGTSDEVIAEQFDFFLVWRHTPVFFDGTVDMLQQVRRLKSTGKGVAADAGSDAAAGTSMHRFVIGAVTDGNSVIAQIPELRDLFDFSIRAEDVGVYKPNVEIFEKAVKEAQHVLDRREPGVSHPLPPSEVLMVGDNFHKDVAGGHRAGMHTCWIAAQRHEACDDGPALPAGIEDEQHVSKTCSYIYPSVADFIAKEVLPACEPTKSVVLTETNGTHNAESSKCGVLRPTCGTCACVHQ